jgi:hypothetical protein
MRTIPTKEQVLKAAQDCPQTKDALKILFPEDFKAQTFKGKIAELGDATLFEVKGNNSRIELKGLPLWLFDKGSGSWNLNTTGEFFLRAVRVACESADNARSFKELVNILARNED